MSREDPCDAATDGKAMQQSGPIPGRCGASTRDGGYCDAWPVKGKKRCRMHGGADGIGRPLIHGRYSRVARGALKAKLERWEDSEEDWRSCRAEIALQQALLETFVSKLPDDGRDRLGGGALLTRVGVSLGACRATEPSCLSRATGVGDRSGPPLTRDGATRVASEGLGLVEGGILTRPGLLESEPTAVLLTTLKREARGSPIP